MNETLLLCETMWFSRDTMRCRYLVCVELRCIIYSSDVFSYYYGKIIVCLLLSCVCSFHLFGEYSLCLQMGYLFC